MVKSLINGKHPAAALTQYLAQNAPGINYTHLAAQHLFLNGMYNSIDPGYTDKLKAQARKYHETYFLPP